MWVDNLFFRFLLELFKFCSIRFYRVHNDVFFSIYWGDWIYLVSQKLFYKVCMR